MKNLLSIFNKYTDKYLSSLLILFIDTCISLFSSISVVLLLKYWLKDSVNFLFAISWVGISVFSSLLLFYLFKSYRMVIRHMTLRDVMVFFYITLIKILFLLAVILYVFDAIKDPYILIASLFDGVLTFALLMFIRALMVFAYNIIRKHATSDKRTKVCVCGISDKSVALVTRHLSSADYTVTGFLKNEKEFSSHVILGLNVYNYSDAKSLSKLKDQGIMDAILMSSETFNSEYRDKLVQDALAAEVKILVAPSIEESKDGVVNHHPIREIKIEDLLGRKEIIVAMDVIKNYFTGKVVMVTGAAGSIGSELCRQLATLGVKQLILFDNAETPMHNIRLELEDRFPYLQFVPVIGDVRSKERLDFVFREYRPQVLFHAAAYKHVPLMEENPCEAVRVNVVGSRNVAEKCLEYDVERMVMISTDKAVNPTNIMGCTKRLAEIYVQSLGQALEKGEREGKTKFVTTRFGNVLGSNGSVIPRFREQILKGGPVTVTHPDITRFFMTIPEACRLVMEAATMTSGNQIFVFDMGESVKIDTLARNMIKLAGFKPDVDIKIEYSGLRPGEKLYEEVLSNVENTLPTTNDRIRVAKVRDYKFTDAAEYFSQLAVLSSDVKIDEMVKLMKEIVPEYKSQNSRFQYLDK